MDAPTMKRNAGKTRSANVKPFHGAWASVEYVWVASPGVLTMIIPAMARPRNASSDRSRTASAGELGEDLIGEQAQRLGRAEVRELQHEQLHAGVDLRGQGLG